MFRYIPKHLLITGGAGFIGSHFIRFLLQHYSDIKIYNLDKLTYAGSLNNLLDIVCYQNYRFIQGDICDQQLIAELLHQYEIDTIVHFAAESHVDQSIKDPAKFIYNNVLGTQILLEQVRCYWKKRFDLKFCRFHHVSTDEVYGSLNAEDEPFTEETAYAPNSPYSASKASSNHIVRAYYKTYGLPVTISNCSNNYGSHQHCEKFIPTIVRSCINSDVIPIYGDGQNRRDWLFVLDHCRAIDLILRQGDIGETYNIGGGFEIDNYQLAIMICDIMDAIKTPDNSFRKLITFVKDRPGHDFRYAINSQKIKERLGWQPQFQFTDNLLTTIRWYDDAENTIEQFSNAMG